MLSIVFFPSALSDAINVMSAGLQVDNMTTKYFIGKI
jgi:hypothetical protein